MIKTTSQYSHQKSHPLEHCKDSISLGLMVFPVTLSNGQTYDLTSVLQLYVNAGGQLNRESTPKPVTITCPQTRDKLEIDPTTLTCSVAMNNMIGSLYDSLNTQEKPDYTYTTLPDNIDIVNFMFYKLNLSEQVCLNYLANITKEHIHKNKNIYKELIYYATINGHKKTLKKLFKLDQTLLAVQYSHRLTLACLAADCEQIAILKLLFKLNEKQCFNTDDYGASPVEYAVAYGRITALKALCEIREKILEKRCNADNSTLAILAAKHGQTEILELIIDQNANQLHEKDKHGFTPAYYAAENGKTDTLKAILELDEKLLAEKYGPDNSTLAILAADWQHVDILELLSSLDKQQLYKTDKNGVTPVILASSYGRTNTLKALYRIDKELFKCVDKRGNSSVHYAAYHGQKETLKVLHDLDNNLLEAKNNRGRTSAHVAADQGHTEMVELLHKLKPGMLNEMDEKGKGPVHYAKLKQHEKTVELLTKLSSGLHNVKGHDGGTLIITKSSTASKKRKGEDLTIFSGGNGENPSKRNNKNPRNA